ncbi:MAG: hypothetical protein ACREPU_11775 [Rhodanobacteraceae bacterium]
MVKDALCRLEGYFFVYDDRKTEFIKIEEIRTTIIDLSNSGLVINVIDANISLDDVRYMYAQGVGLVATDGKDFSLNINEFSARR